MDKLVIKDLEVYANHGVLKEERELGQKFLVSCNMYLSTRGAALNDDLNETIDYGKICFRITRFLTDHTYKLIETAAEELAKELLYTVPVMEKIDLEIYKPWAPVGLPLSNVGVSISRGWHDVYIGLGSNMGDREAYLKHGVTTIEKSKDCRVVTVSKFIDTKPYGVLEQPDFLNGCMRIKTILPPVELLTFLQGIEHSVNRVREGKWGPRTLDLDILFYDDEIINTPELTVPHSDMKNRDFVLGPLSKIAPNLCHPLYRKTIKMMYDELLESKKEQEQT